MKRDLDLVRKILLEVERHEDPNGSHEVDVEGYSREQIMYHVKIQFEAGLLDAIDFTGNGPMEWHVRSMTWKGHDWLDATRSDTVWNKVKAEAKDRGVSLSFDLAKALAVKLAASALGLHL